ncbi:hypothetical protein D9M70_650220 [compost metagenome]
MLAHQAVLRGQLVAWLEGTQQDLLRQAGDQVMGAAVAAFVSLFDGHGGVRLLLCLYDKLIDENIFCRFF